MKLKKKIINHKISDMRYKLLFLASRILCLLSFICFLHLNIYLHAEEEEFIIIQPEPEPVIELISDDPTPPQDITPPTVTITYPTNSLISNSLITISGTASDNVSVSKVQARVNSGMWVDVTGTSPWSKSVSLTSGLNTIEAHATDTSNNVSAIVSIAITYNPPDTTPPTGSIIINEGNSDYTGSTNVVLYLTYADTGSGVDKVRYGNDSTTWTDWETPTPTKEWKLTQGDGIKTVYYEIKDKVGNVCQLKDTIVLDTLIRAEINITPDTLNLKSEGKWITAYIELPKKYDVNNIDGASVLLNETIKAEVKPTSIGDYDNDGIADLMVKFSREEAQKLLYKDVDVKLTVTGSLIDGRKFAGSDTPRVINPANVQPEVKTEPSDKETVNNQDEKKEKKIRFAVNKKLPENANILTAIFWLITDEKNKNDITVWYQDTVQKKYIHHSQYIQEKGWGLDITDGVKIDSQNKKEVILQVETEDASFDSVLVIVYGEESKEKTVLFDGGKITIPKGSNKNVAISKEKNFHPIPSALISVSEAFKLTETPELPVSITLFYDETQLVNETELKIYFFNEETAQWQEVPNFTLDASQNCISFETTKTSPFIIMAPAVAKAKPVLTSRLGQNYPNPFNPETTINYVVEKDSYVTLKLYNISGQVVATIVDEFQTAKEYSIRFDGKDLSRGIYYYQLKAGDFVATKKMVVLK